MVGNINKANMKILAEADLLLIIILRGRRREKRKPRVWVRQVCYDCSSSCYFDKVESDRNDYLV